MLGGWSDSLSQREKDIQNINSWREFYGQKKKIIVMVLKVCTATKQLKVVLLSQIIQINGGFSHLKTFKKMSQV